MWYVGDAVPVDEAVRRLNDQGAPLPPKCQCGRWQRQPVIILLKNPRYCG